MQFYIQQKITGNGQDPQNMNEMLKVDRDLFPTSTV